MERVRRKRFKIVFSQKSQKKNNLFTYRQGLLSVGLFKLRASRLSKTGRRELLAGN
jgi:hypothetical protein